MGETETEKMIDNKTDLIIKVLMNNDFKGVLLMDLEGYDDKNNYILPEKTTEKIMKQELEYAMDLITEVRKLAMDLNNLDLQAETFEAMFELEQDWIKVYNGIETDNRGADARKAQYPVELIAVASGGMENVLDWT
ncbi:MAG: hypothetical protein WC788_06940 [Candidatus Paceibacterota bacterium]|jgi:hypothetical protein